MNCPSCGAALPEGANFCQVCGRAVWGEGQGPKERYGLAVTSLVLGLLAFVLFFPGLLGILLGIIALRRASPTKEQTRGSYAMAVIGLIVSIVGTLVGMSVFTIWAAILIPVFAAAREKAQAASCMDHMRQLGATTLVYAQDWDGCFPSAAGWDKAIRDGLPLRGAPADVWVCPASQQGYGYALNSGMAWQSVASVAQPSDTVLLFEMDVGGAGVGVLEQVARPRHRAGNNFFFVDGHCAWAAQSRWSQLEWSPIPESLTPPLPPPPIEPPVPGAERPIQSKSGSQG